MGVNSNLHSKTLFYKDCSELHGAQVKGKTVSDCGVHERERPLV